MTAEAVSKATNTAFLGVLFCLASALGYGFLGYFGLGVFTAGGTFQTLLGWRFILAAVTLWLIVALTRRRIRSQRAIVQALLMGAVIYSLQATLYFTAVARLNVGLAALLLYTMPAMVVLVELLRRRVALSPKLALAVVLAIGGVAVTILGPGAMTLAPIGLLCGIGSAVVYTAYYFSMETLPKGTDPLAAAALVCTGAAATQVLVGSSLGTFDFTPSAAELVWLVPMALVCTVIGLTFLMIGVNLAGPAVASVVSCVEPITSVLLGASLVGDPFGAAQIGGTVAVVAAVVLLGIGRSKPAEEMVMEHG